MSETTTHNMPFREKNTDPGFLVAKGRFHVEGEKNRESLFRERDFLLHEGHAGDDEKVVGLTRQIETLNTQINKDCRKLEKEHVKHLASAIFMAMSNHGYANIRCVGNRAVYNSVKAIAIASGYCKQKGIDLCFEVSFDEGNLGTLRDKHHVKSVTAMLFKLKGYQNWLEGEKDERIEARPSEDAGQS